MGLLTLLFKDPFAFVLVAVPLLYSIMIHELAHGWVADKMGDPTAKWLGRLTLNPLKHLDPIGTAMLLVVGFGWAKPVPVNFNNLKDSRKGIIFVSAAGIVANLLLAFLSFFLLRYVSPVSSRTLFIALQYMAHINVMLAAFNLIPIPPLDGSKILMGFASRKFQYTMARIEPYGMFILIGLLFLGVLNPFIRFLESIILSVLDVLIP